LREQEDLKALSPRETEVRIVCSRYETGNERMASIRKRGPYQWEARIRRAGYPLQSRTFESRPEAEAWARSLETEMDRGVFVSRTEAERTTLSEALERYAREITPRKKGATVELGRIRAWWRRPLARRTLASLRGKDFADFIAERQSQGIGAHTIRLDLALISHLFAVARTAWGMESLGNPVEAARFALPKLPRGRERRLVIGEEERLMDAARDFERSRSTAGPIASLIGFALETGMRRGELAAMRWEHVDRNTCVLRVPEAKNGSPRSVPLSSRATKILGALPRRLDGQVWGLRQDSITQAFGQVLHNAREEYQEECHRSAIEPDATLLIGLRFHDLRHEAISRLFERGLNPMQVAAISGHKTLQMLKRYTHLRAEELVALLG
jgi:integrase